MKSKIIARIFFFVIIAAIGLFAIVPSQISLAATSTPYLAAPYSRTGINVQQGWVSHFAKPPKCCINAKCTARYQYDSKKNICIHGGIDYILGKPQTSSSTWKSFDVVASINGVVKCGYSSVYGNNIVMIQTYGSNTIKILYAHLKSTAYCGKSVQRGTVIGKAGDTGSAKGTGVHLHFDVYKNGIKVDPYTIKKKWNYYPPYKSINWNLLNNYLWIIKNSSIQVITPTPIPTSTASDPIPAPFTVQSSLDPAYPDACSANNQWMAITGGYLTLNIANAVTEDHAGRWYPVIPLTGKYKIEAFIPNHPAITWTCNGSTITGDTSAAKYQIWHADGKTSVIIDQLPLSNEYVTLGTFRFDASQIGAQYIKLANITTEDNQTRTISYGQIRFTYIGP